MVHLAGSHRAEGKGPSRTVGLARRIAVSSRLDHGVVLAEECDTRRDGRIEGDVVEMQCSLADLFGRMVRGRSPGHPFATGHACIVI